MARQLEHFDNLVSMFLTRAAEKGDEPFLWAKRDGEWRPTSWSEAARQVAALAASLKRIGLEPRRPRHAGQREPPRMADRRPRDHGRGLRHGADLHHQHDARSHPHPRQLRRQAVIVSNQKLAKTLIPAVLSSSECHHVIGIEDIRTGQATDVGQLPSLGRAGRRRRRTSARSSSGLPAVGRERPRLPHLHQRHRRRAARRPAAPRLDPPQRRGLHRRHLDRFRLGRRSLPVVPAREPRL